MVLHLPDEILLNIFTNADSYTLHSLCRTTKTCYNIAQPLLFCTFNRRQVGTTRSLDNLRDNLPLFLRTLTIVHVRYVKLKSWEYDEHEFEPPTSPPSLSMTLAYQSLITKLSLSVPTKKRLVASLGNGSEDVEVALLVALCLNLEKIRYRHRSWSRSLTSDGART